MDGYELTAPCHFGLESVLKREITDLGYEIKKVEDGRVTFAADAQAICRTNMFLRTGERVLLKIGAFRAENFDQLFEGTKALPWEDYIPKDGKFWVKKASSVKSSLLSLPDIQSVVKKAMVERMKERYHVSWFEESGADYPVRAFVLKDEVTLYLDTSGVHLHKRGYRLLKSKAPLTEDLAAALIMLTPWKKDRILLDPFCGSGTFLIEAAMMAAGIAPGLNRSFTAQAWDNLIEKKDWDNAKEQAKACVDTSIETDLQGFDCDGDIIRAARENAKRAGVEHLIHFQQRDVADLRHPKKYGFIITNPPYGERLEDKKDLPSLYSKFADALESLDTWSVYVISGYNETERYLRKKAAKKRKVYNGMLRTDFYQFPGPKPPGRKR